MAFELASQFQPTGDQPLAIEQLSGGIAGGQKHQTLLGVTGSGKTFTMANVIQQTQLPTLIIAHNKTLAAQLYQEFRDFFPHNAVSYFVSYYDYYQPEAYIASTDTYIEKEATINDEIDRLRLATTTNLLTRPDVIVVASVSCIYNLGSPVEYGRYLLEIVEGEVISRQTLLLQLANLQYDRSDAELRRGTFRMRGDSIQLWPAYEDTALRIDTLENRITSIDRIDPVTGSVIEEPKTKAPIFSDQPSLKRYVIYPAKHYVVNPKTQEQALADIKRDLDAQLAEFKAHGKTIEAYRLEQKVTYDMEMIKEFGFVNGIENYSRYFDGRKPGDAPFTLLDYFLENARLFNQGRYLTFIDESHISVPQIRGMHHGDRSRKETLIQYGFRLPSALDNRPLQFHEFQLRTPQTIYVSATPNEWEISQSNGQVTEQLIRPTGLIDPEIELRRSEGQIEDLIIEIITRKAIGQRTLVTTLTKRMAEALTEYLNDEGKVRKLVRNFRDRKEQQQNQVNPEAVISHHDELPIDNMEIGKIPDQYLSQAKLPEASKLTADALLLPKVAYLHSDIETLERSDILDDLRRGVYDVVVGINLLREGLDLPEVTLVAILDADKEGFLRSRTSLIQTLGRAARHSEGRAILYADKLTLSMKAAIQETLRRRHIQIKFNEQHGITPQTIVKPIRDRMIEKKEEEDESDSKNTAKKKAGVIVHLSKKESVNLSELEPDNLTPGEKKRMADKLRRRMKQAANDMDFELAAMIRDVVNSFE
ncbi:MAG TPA: excinuclease ABC subunit UvrB [Vitreimonas sp.]|nr:excinuclease ABC subunit UvrB [Vitreimonas sp.]